MQIKFSVRYVYYPAAPIDERFKAEVSAFLPKAQDRDSIPPCYLGKLGYYEVEYDSKEITVEFYAHSLEELDSKIELAIENYRQQVLRNIEIIQKFKECREREIIKDFPDPIKEGFGIIAELPDLPDLNY